MASRRMILKIDLESPKWTHLLITQRYLYWGLTLIADDDGIVPLFMINRVVFDKDDLSEEYVEQALSDLEIEGFVSVYSCKDGDKYIQIAKWWDKQFIAKNIYKPTDYPVSSNHMIRPDDLTKKHQSSFYHSSSKPLDQNRIDKSRTDKSSRDQSSEDKTIPEEKREEEHVDPNDEFLPF
jgi:hypothetical protein